MVNTERPRPVLVTCQLFQQETVIEYGGNPVHKYVCSGIVLQGETGKGRRVCRTVCPTKTQTAQATRDRVLVIKRLVSRRLSNVWTGKAPNRECPPTLTRPENFKFSLLMTVR